MPDINSQSNPFYWGDDGISILSAVRLGQPADRLFRLLSPSVEHSLRYIESAVRQGHPLVKLVVGEMGSGKTTLNKLFTQTAAEAGAKTVGINLPYLPSVRELNIVSDMITPTHLMTACIEKIREHVLAGHMSMGAAISDAFQSHRICTSYQAIATYYSKVANGGIKEDEQLTPEILAQRLSEAIAVWLQGGRVAELKDFVMQVAGYNQTFGTIAMSDAGTIFTGSLRLYRLLNIYPTWMLDEFESVGGLNVTKQKNHLGMYRDMVDMIYSVSWGALMMFSTPDGVEVIRRYPALYDRLQGPSGFLITSPTWETKQFSEWEPDILINIFRSLYINAAGQGDYVANHVINHLAELDSTDFKAFATEITEANTILPRLRLKEFVFAIDRLAQGVEAFRSGIATQQDEAKTPALVDKLEEFEPFSSTVDAFVSGSESVGAVIVRPESTGLPPTRRPAWLNAPSEASGTEPPRTSADVEDVLDRLLNEYDIENDDSDEIKLTGFVFAPRLNRSVEDALSKLARLNDQSEGSETAACFSLCRDSGMTLKELMTNPRVVALNNLHVSDCPMDERYLNLKALLQSMPKDELMASPYTPLLHEGNLVSVAPVSCNHLEVLFQKTVPNPEYPEADRLKKAQDLRIKMLEENHEKGLISKAEYDKVPKEKKIKLPNKLMQIVVKVRIDPFLSIGQLRHFIYCVSINAGFILSDRLADQLTMDVMKTRTGYEPTTSRNGIAFVKSEGIMRLWGRGTYYADTTLSADAEYADFISEHNGERELPENPGI